MKHLLLVLIAFTFPASAQVKSFEAKINRVLDGDSVEFTHSDGNLDKVRFLGLILRFKEFAR